MQGTRTLDPPAAIAATAAGEASAVTVTPARPSILRDVREAWRGRALLPRLGVRFLIKFTYGTKLGRSWLVIRPLMSSLGMTLLFGTVLGVATPNGVPYYLFLMAGLLAWHFFERSLRYGARSFSLYRRMMTNFHFPLLLVPLAGMAYPLMEIFIYWLVFLGAVLFFWAIDGSLYLQGSPQLLMVIPATALLMVITTGACLWVSVLNAKARDVILVLRYVAPIWMYATPVIYPPEKLPDSFEWVATVNPMSAPVQLMKDGLLGTGGVSMAAVWCSAGFGALLLVSGLWFFSREAARSIDALGPGDDEDEL
jgi:lipopolysaccharide transport system permease protein